MKNRRNYYRILQVQPDAPPEIIRASYRTMMLELKMHPDVGGSSSEAAMLNEAYEMLIDPERRAAYDEKQFLEFTKQTQSRRPAVPVLCPICKRALQRKPEPGELCTACRTPLPAAEPEESPRSQRALERTRNSEQVSFYASWPGQPSQGRMIDFSPKGMRFICTEKIAARTVLKISSRLFEASGTVTNVSEEISGKELCYAVGVCFLAVNFTESRGTFFSTSA
jgi:hypothetical protein